DPAAGHHDGVRGEASLEDLVPAHEPSAVRREKVIHLRGEPALELVLAVEVSRIGGIVGRDTERLDLLLRARTSLPFRLDRLVAPNGDEIAGEQPHDLPEPIPHDTQSP